MRFLLYILVNILIIGLFLYSQLTRSKARLNGMYLNVYNIFEGLFNPLLIFLGKIAKPVQIGNGLAIDMSQIILLVLFLFILKIIL
jgi:hypothetical protein